MILHITGTMNINWRNVLEKYSFLVEVEVKATLRLLKKDSNLNGFITDEKFKDFFCRTTNEWYVAILLNQLKIHLLINRSHEFEM